MFFPFIFTVVSSLAGATSRLPCAIFQARLQSVVERPQATLKLWSEEPGLDPVIATGLRLQASVLGALEEESRQPASAQAEVTDIVFRAFQRARGPWMSNAVGAPLRVPMSGDISGQVSYFDVISALVGRTTNSSVLYTAETAVPSVLVPVHGLESDTLLAHAAVSGIHLIGVPTHRQVADGTVFSDEGFTDHDHSHAEAETQAFRDREPVIAFGVPGLNSTSLLEYFGPRLRDEARFKAIIEGFARWKGERPRVSERDELLMGRLLLYAFREAPFAFRFYNHRFGPNHSHQEAEVAARDLAGFTFRALNLQLQRLTQSLEPRGIAATDEMLRTFRLHFDRSHPGLWNLPETVHQRLRYFARILVNSAWEADRQIDGI